MEQHMDRQNLSTLSSFHTREDSCHNTGLNKKRKLPCQHTNLASPLSKQKLENPQQIMELPESSENNSMNSLVTNNADDPCTVLDWPCTSCASSSSIGSTSIEFDSANNFRSESLMVSNCKEEGSLKELEALHDPAITELVDAMEGCEDADALGSMLYSNGLDFLVTQPVLGEAMQGGSRQLTIDQEFMQYFSKLML